MLALGLWTRLGCGLGTHASSVLALGLWTRLAYDLGTHASSVLAFGLWGHASLTAWVRTLPACCPSDCGARLAYVLGTHASSVLAFGLWTRLAYDLGMHASSVLAFGLWGTPRLPPGYARFQRAGLRMNLLDATLQRCWLLREVGHAGSVRTQGFGNLHIKRLEDLVDDTACHYVASSCVAIQQGIITDVVDHAGDSL